MDPPPSRPPLPPRGAPLSFVQWPSRPCGTFYPGSSQAMVSQILDPGSWTLDHVLAATGLTCLLLHCFLTLLPTQAYVHTSPSPLLASKPSKPHILPPPPLSLRTPTFLKLPDTPGLPAACLLQPHRCSCQARPSYLSTSCACCCGGPVSHVPAAVEGR